MEVHQAALGERERQGEAGRSQTVALLKAGFLLGLVRIDRRGFEMAQEGKAN